MLYDEGTRICYTAGEKCSCLELWNAMLVMTDSRTLAERLVVEGAFWRS